MSQHKGVIVCVDPRAAETGAQILEVGGNAFDAVVAVAFVQSVVLPFSCGVGGFMSANLWQADTGDPQIVDGCLRAGSLVTADMWAADYRGEADFSGASLFDDHRSDMGYSSICDALRERGFTVVHQSASLSAQMARAQLVIIGPDGKLAGCGSRLNILSVGSNVSGLGLIFTATIVANGPTSLF
jgi:hypothetical protein